MAETTAKEELQKNWDELESEGDDDNEEIGITGEPPKTETAQEEVKEKKSWKQLQAEKREEDKRKAANAPIQRVKNERGDYVVTGFTIPDRLEQKDKLGDKAEKKSKKAGLFQLDSDEEEEEVKEEQEEDEAVVVQVKQQ